MEYTRPHVFLFHFAFGLSILVTAIASVILLLLAFRLSRKFQIENQPPLSDKYNQETEKTAERELSDFPILDADLEMVRRAVRKFAEELPKGVFRTILVQEDNSIDFKQLIHILGGMPIQKFYMSKETYEIFEDRDKQIAIEMDLVQKAVDQYVKDHKEYPMLPFDSEHRVNYYQLVHGHYLAAPPETVFYITDLEGLITHRKPEIKSWENG